MSDRALKSTEINNHYFYLSVSNCEFFDGNQFEPDGHYIPPVDNKYKLQQAIDATMSIYTKLQEEYKSLYGKEY